MRISKTIELAIIKYFIGKLQHSKFFNNLNSVSSNSQTKINLNERLEYHLQKSFSYYVLNSFTSFKVKKNRRL